MSFSVLLTIATLLDETIILIHPLPRVLWEVYCLQQKIEPPVSEPGVLLHIANKDKYKNYQLKVALQKPVR